MIYGLNFNGKDIPPGIRRKFAERVKAGSLPSGKARWAYIKGVCQSADEAQMMISQADNGHRQFLVEKRHAADGDWWGVYVY